MCDKEFIWNPSNCESECDKACDAGEYLDYENCKRRKKLVAPLVHECAEPVEAVKLAKINLAENEKSYCSSCTMYIVLFWIHFTINVGGIGIFTGTWKKMSLVLSLILALRQRFTKQINGKTETNQY